MQRLLCDFVHVWFGQRARFDYEVEREFSYAGSTELRQESSIDFRSIANREIHSPLSTEMSGDSHNAKNASERNQLLAGEYY